MQQLIQQLTEQYNLSEEEATGIIVTVKNYQPANAENTDAAETGTEAVTPTASAEPKEDTILEKAEHFVTDHLPGGLKEKAEELMGGLGNKVKGLFS